MLKKRYRTKNEGVGFFRVEYFNGLWWKDLGVVEGSGSVDKAIANHKKTGCAKEITYYD